MTKPHREIKLGFHIVDKDGIDERRRHEARFRENLAAMAQAANLGLQQIIDSVNAAMPAILEAAEALDPDLDTRPPRADGRPHPPRPSTTPPMWAVDATRSRRRR